jgi:catechol 2,3-dioxygenase-like lactoylglutathione lyase family enzyme
MIDVRGIAPLLSVFDMPTSIHFYCDKLGFQIVSSDQKPAPDFDWALLTLNGIELMLNTAYEKPERPPKADPVRIASHEDVCLYFGAPDVDAVYEHLKALGVVANPPKVAPYGMKQLYVTDPDGYLLCFQWKA